VKGRNSKKSGAYSFPRGTPRGHRWDEDGRELSAARLGGATDAKSRSTFALRSDKELEIVIPLGRSEADALRKCPKVDAKVERSFG